MKTLTSAILVLMALFATVQHASSQEFAMFGRLPGLDKSWILDERGTNRTSYSVESWIIFTNSTSGDVLSFYEKRYGNKPVPKPVNQGPWTEMAISIFPGGYPAWNKPPGLRIKDSAWGRS